MNRSRLPIWKFLRGSKDRDEEAAYRQHYVADDVSQARAIVYVSCTAMIVLTLVDIPSVVADPSLLTGTALRIGMIIFGFVLAAALKRAGTPGLIDLGAVTYGITIGVGILIYHVVNEPSAVRIGMIGVLFIFAISIGLPTYAVLTSIPILTLVLGDVALFFFSGREDLYSQRVVMLTVYLAATFIAAFASAHMQRSRYHAFVALRQVKTLSGLLPICAHCKKIRDDEGEYQAIESYIRDRSEAEFSHGLCPDCIEEHYPEVRAGTRDP